MNTLEKSLLLALAISVTACATPRSVDSVGLARIAKDYIGVGSIDEMEISNVQKLAEGPVGRTNYRFFVDTAKKKKFICDVSLAAVGMEGKLIGSDIVKCEVR
jgi:hypothetical protein